MIGLPYAKESVMTRWAVLIQYWSMTIGRTELLTGHITSWVASLWTGLKGLRRRDVAYASVYWNNNSKDWQDITPSIARANGQWIHGAASRHTIAPISHTRPPWHRSPQHVRHCSLPVPLREEGWVGLQRICRRCTFSAWKGKKSKSEWIYIGPLL